MPYPHKIDPAAQVEKLKIELRTFALTRSPSDLKLGPIIMGIRDAVREISAENLKTHVDHIMASIEMIRGFILILIMREQLDKLDEEMRVVLKKSNPATYRPAHQPSFEEAAIPRTKLPGIATTQEIEIDTLTANLRRFVKKDPESK